jgi:hypothetical protein
MNQRSKVADMISSIGAQRSRLLKWVTIADLAGNVQCT